MIYKWLAIWGSRWQNYIGFTIIILLWFQVEAETVILIFHKLKFQTYLLNAAFQLTENKLSTITQQLIAKCDFTVILNLLKRYV